MGMAAVQFAPEDLFVSRFGLDAGSVLDRVRPEKDIVKLPSLSASVLRGALGFTWVSILGFLPWVLAGRWFYRNTGEAGLYAVCAMVFIGASGPLMHRLILGPGSLWRFYALFGIAFSGYAIAWIGAWMSLGGHTGSLVGLLFGTAWMGGILAWAFAARKVALPIIAVLFLLNSTGYFAGGLADAFILDLKSLIPTDSTRSALAHLSWALPYGMGFGAGLGYAFHQAQKTLRQRISNL